MCYWELCDDEMQTYGPETCWMEFCQNACGEERCEEWHAYDQDANGEWLWYQQDCQMSEEEMYMEYAEDAQDFGMFAQQNYNETIAFAVEEFGLD
jgi:hypothetical protein